MTSCRDAGFWHFLVSGRGGSRNVVFLVFANSTGQNPPCRHIVATLGLGDGVSRAQRTGTPSASGGELYNLEACSRFVAQFLALLCALDTARVARWPSVACRHSGLDGSAAVGVRGGLAAGSLIAPIGCLRGKRVTC